MLIALYILTVAISVFVFTLLGCHAVRLVLKVSNVWDEPNERSNHTVPVPRGGGIAVMFTVLSFMMVTGASSQMLWAAFGLAIVSFLDDVQGVPVRSRLLVQVAGVALTLLGLESDQLLFQGMLPLWLDRVLIGVGLLGFMNLTNFMDGIDGITGAHIISLGLGFIVLGVASEALGRGFVIDGVILIAAAAGFLMLNWHPARLFLGDVGSIPLGLITGYILLEMALAGHVIAALILPAYYVVDGGITFCGRILNRQKVWEAHSRHAYQRAVRRGWSHDEVVRWMLAFNAILILLSVAAVLYPVVSLPVVVVAYVEAFLLRTLFCTRKSVAVRQKVANVNRKLRDGMLNRAVPVEDVTPANALPLGKISAE